MPDDAFTAMLEAHSPMLTRVAASIVGVDSAPDCVQDACLRAWRSRATFDGRNPGGWLATIVRNCATGSLRRRRFVTVVLDALPERPDGRERPDDAALRRELGEALAAALAAIPRDQAEAVVLCCGQGVTYDEYGARFGIPRNTLGTRVLRGRRRLKTLLTGV